MSRPARIAAVIIGLVVAGAVFGAVAGGTALTASLLITDDATSGLSVFGAVVGAEFGAVAAPLIGLIGLRRVPIGRMFVGCAVGTMVGGIVGWVPTTSSSAYLWFPKADNGVIGAVIGCLVAAVLLHYRARRLEG
jgi:hypothetical protein